MPTKEFFELLSATEDIQFIIVKGGGMARKSDVEKILMGEFDLTQFDARNLTNHVEFQNNRTWKISDGKAVWIAKRDEPTRAKYHIEKYASQLKWFQ